ncbi:maternal effect embryo arrest protein, partial [Trifolium medium]|nr:maternal effect embryo arrest protein [Trifolium medium]
DTPLVETEIGSLHNQPLNFGLVVSDREDNSSISRTLLATRNCIARCSLDTQTGWAVASILTAVDMEEISLQK